MLLAACVGPGAPGAEPADWPQWRGPRRDGVSMESNWLAKWPPAGPKVLWKAKVGEGFSGFAIVGARLDTMGFVRRQGVQSPGMGKEPGQDHVWCLHAATGQEIWKHAYRSTKGSYYGPFVTPTVEGDRVYTLGKFGQLFCLDAATGRALWSTDITVSLKAKRPYYGYSSMPVVVGELLILHGGRPGPSLAALNKNTGEVFVEAQVNKFASADS